MSEEILKQRANIKGLVCYYRRDLDKLQQEIEGLKVISHSTKEIGIQPEPRQPEPRGLERAVLSRGSLRFRVSQLDRVVDQSGTEDTGRVVNRNLDTLGIMEKRATGPANVEQSKSTEACEWNFELREGRSVSSRTR